MHAQDLNVTAQIEVVGEGPARTNKKDRTNVVVWLTPLDERTLRLCERLGGLLIDLVVKALTKRVGSARVDGTLRDVLDPTLRGE